MSRIAVTGGIACGKSLVGQFLRERGGLVCEADELAHEAMRKDGEIFEKIVSVFGRRILRGDGDIDRAILGEMVFKDPTRMSMLNRLVHPSVIQRLEAWLSGDGAGARHGVRVAIVPLLYEVGLGTGWDAVVCVAAPVGRRRVWLRSRGLAESAVDLRIEAQMPQSEKMILADYVIFNSGTEEVLRTQTSKVWSRIMDKEQRTGEEE